MAEYIEREALLAEFDKNKPQHFGDVQEWIDYGVYSGIAETIPAADVQEVRHGSWRFIGVDRWNDTYECSVCGAMAMDDSPYCPNCGAKMDGKGEKSLLYADLDEIIDATDGKSEGE